MSDEVRRDPWILAVPHTMGAAGISIGEQVGGVLVLFAQIVRRLLPPRIDRYAFSQALLHHSEFVGRLGRVPLGAGFGIDFSPVGPAGQGVRDGGKDILLDVRLPPPQSKADFSRKYHALAFIDDAVGQTAYSCKTGPKTSPCGARATSRAEPNAGRMARPWRWDMTTANSRPSS